MKLLLINPWICDVAAYDFWMKPLGLLYVGAILEKMGFDVELLDMTDRFSPPLQQFLKERGVKLKNGPFGSGKFYSEEIEKPPSLSHIPRRFKRYGLPKAVVEKLFSEKLRDVDGVFMTSGMTYWYWGIIETMQVLRAYSNVPVALGGIYVNLMKEHACETAKLSGVDLVVEGHGTEAARKALTGLDLRAFPPNMTNFDWFEDLSPAYHLYCHSLPYAVLLASVGCIFRCSYCATPWIWKRFRPKTVDATIRDVETVLDLGIKTVAFYDDAFLLHPQLKELLERLRAFRDRVNFILPNGIHARFVNRWIAKALKEAGFRLVYLGLETSGELQKTTGGKVTDEEFVRAVKLLKEAGFNSEEIKAYIMINMPGQKVEDVERAIELCEWLEIVYSLNEYAPIPGTLDWKKLTKNGSLSEDVDPLLLDNSILPYWWKEGMDICKVKAFKERKLILNRDVEIHDHQQKDVST